MKRTGFIGTRCFRRSLQMDDYSCGARSVLMVLRHFGRSATYSEVREALRPDPEHGTTINPMIRLMRRHGLRVGYRPRLTLRGLTRALARGAVIIVHLDGDHLGVVHGVDLRFVWLADPSLRRMLGRRITMPRFRKRWSQWGLVIVASRSESSTK